MDRSSGERAEDLVGRIRGLHIGDGRIALLRWMIHIAIVVGREELREAGIEEKPLADGLLRRIEGDSSVLGNGLPRAIAFATSNGVCACRRTC